MPLLRSTVAATSGSLLAALSLVLSVVLLGGAACAEGPIDFNASVRPIFVRHCLACHGGVKQSGGLSLVTRVQAMTEGDSGAAVISPGDHTASYLYDRIADPDDDSRMPPVEHGRRLNDAELSILRRWIDEGAAWEQPWAFRPPQRVAPPEANGDRWSRTPADRFIYRQLQAEGLEPSPEADRAQWLRRVSFDLVGLPPTESERLGFETDREPGAYERVVDRLLASPHYGERWASVWLDLARYADTMGYERDPNRDAWPYRDWVVRAFNTDTPYDEFLLKQTAGDLLEDATIGDRLATAFHRNTQTNVEGGTDDEEYRWAAVVDRVDTTWQAVLGTTMGCARCHDHPYDPLWQEDYYRFAAFFNTTRDADLVEDWPKLATPVDPARYDEAAAIDSELSDVRQRLHGIGVALAESPEAWKRLPIDAATSTGQTSLQVRTGERGVEVDAVGTVTDRSIYTLSAPAPVGEVTAVRVDASPVDPATALVQPEMGFVLSRIRVLVDRAPTEAAPQGETATDEPFLVEALADEADGFFRPIESIRDSAAGWGPYTRMRRPRWAVFVFDRPVVLRAGDRLRVELKHGMATDGQGPLVMPRVALSTTSDARFTDLVSDPVFTVLREREEVLIQSRDAIPSTGTPVMQEQAAWLRRPTYLLDRGDWLSPTTELQPATPQDLPGEATNRLELARWLGSDENPLTARVMVNRVWAELFGIGLVATLDDFGSTGAEPSHPELLDDLSVRFRDDFDWSVKRLLRELVLSATYRQDASASPTLVERDPTNRLLARGPRGRLRAEMVRDQALLVSGRINPALGGPPVMPYQPEGVWQSVFNNARWQTSDGDQRYRRALYTFWKRTAAYPSMVAFDAPSREQCTARRPTTNTPLQALVTLNDPAFVELAEGLAERMLDRPGETAPQRIVWAAREATGRALPSESLAELTRLYDEVLAEHDADQRFAMKVVANVLLNLDATLTK